MAEGSVRPIEEADRIVVARLVLELWGAHTAVAHGEVFFPASLPGFLVEKQGHVLGLLTYAVANHQLEIVTIDALRRGRGVGTALVGLTIGVTVAAFAGRGIESFLFQVDALDPASLAVAALVLAVVAVLASYLPARRVTRIDPVESLRAE